jgi:AraC-like DNA-binding protein
MLSTLLTINMLVQNNRIKPVSDKICYETSTVTLKNFPTPSLIHPWLPSGCPPPKDKNSAQRITSVFLEFLERQFPIESVEHPLQLKTAQDFASNLFVHVNHLNSTVKKITGKSTTTHITDRMIHEARALLQHTNWIVAEIAYALGFEYPTYFNILQKKNSANS